MFLRIAAGARIYHCYRIGNCHESSLVYPCFDADFRDEPLHRTGLRAGFLSDVFVRKLRPDNPKEFAAGKLGVLLPTYPRADLVVAFRYLNGGILSATEQKAYQPTYSVAEVEFDSQPDSETTAKE